MQSRLLDQTSSETPSASSPTNRLAQARKSFSTSEILKRVQQKRADGWTRFTTLGDALGAFLGTGYWIAQAIDSTLQQEDYLLGLSKPAFYTGLATAAFCASCAGYIHYIVNVNHQHDALHEKQMSEEDVTRHNTLSNELADLEENTSIDPKAKSAIKAARDILDGNKYEILPKKPSTPVENTSLSFLQKVAVVGDAITHIGDGAGTPTFLYNLATDPSSLSVWVNLSVQFGATLFGSINMRANIRTDMTNLRKHNQYLENLQAEEAEEAVYMPVLNRV